MLSKLYNYYQIARQSLFYIPALVCLVYTAMCLGFFALDHTYADNLKDIPVLFNGTLSDAKEIIRVLLSSMITLTVLVISITMVVLSLSANQMGPRLILIFLSNQKTKIYMGLFFGSIAASFVLIGLLHETKSADEIPRLSISAVFIFCFLNLFVLLSYVQHIAQLSVADEVISKVHRELLQSIKRLRAKGSGEEQKVKKDSWPKDFDKKAQKIFSDKSGYVQTIDYKAILELAKNAGAQVKIEYAPGDYIIQNAQIARVLPKNKATPEFQDDLFDAFVFGDVRTATQDIQYSSYSSKEPLKEDWG